MYEDIDFIDSPDPLGTPAPAVIEPPGKYGRWTGIRLSDRDIAKNNDLFVAQATEKTKAGEEKMKVKATGVCEVCRKEGRPLTASYGKDVCTACSLRRSEIHKHKDLVIEEFTEFFGSSPLPAGQSEESAQNIKLKKEAERREQFIDFLARENKDFSVLGRDAPLGGYLDSLQAERQRLEDEVADLTAQLAVNTKDMAKEAEDKRPAFGEVERTPEGLSLCSDGSLAGIAAAYICHTITSHFQPV